MKKLIYFAVLTSVVLFMSCVAPIYVSEDYDRHANFPSYKTFDWMPKPDKMPPTARQAIESSPFLAKRIQDITAQILTAKGMTQSSVNPDIVINYYVSFKERYDIADWGYYYGRFWAYRWPYLGPYDYYAYQQGTLVLDFVDAKKKEMVWRGVADQAMPEYDRSSSISEDDLRKIITKLLALYPPQPYTGWRH